MSACDIASRLLCRGNLVDRLGGRVGFWQPQQQQPQQQQQQQQQQPERDRVHALRSWLHDQGYDMVSGMHTAYVSIRID